MNRQRLTVRALIGATLALAFATPLLIGAQTPVATSGDVVATNVPGPADIPASNGPIGTDGTPPAIATSPAAPVPTQPVNDVAADGNTLPADPPATPPSTGTPTRTPPTTDRLTAMNATADAALQPGQARGHHFTRNIPPARAGTTVHLVLRTVNRAPADGWQVRAQPGPCELTGDGATCSAPFSPRPPDNAPPGDYSGTITGDGS